MVGKLRQIRYGEVDVLSGEQMGNGELEVAEMGNSVVNDRCSSFH